MSSSKKYIKKDNTNGNTNGTVSPHLEKLSLGPRQPVGDGEVDIKKLKKHINGQMLDMIQNLEKECYKIIFTTFPAKIQELDDMWKNKKEFNLKRDQIISEVQIPSENDLKAEGKEDYKRKLFRTPVPANKAVRAVMDIIEDQLLFVSDILDTLSIWVKLNVPRIADGNNFGVEVQEEITGVLDEAGTAAQAMLDMFSVYHLSRGELISKILMRPGIDDYQQALKEMDNKQYIKVSLLTCELRNDYITLYDLLAKNLETLKAPRGNSEQNLSTMY